MAEYIEREDLIRRFEYSIKSLGRDCNSNAPIMARTYEEAVYRVKNIPAADVVPVVRSKDCKHCDHFYPRCDKDGTLEEMYSCMMFDYIVQPDCYCSYGEMKI